MTDDPVHPPEDPRTHCPQTRPGEPIDPRALKPTPEQDPLAPDPNIGDPLQHPPGWQPHWRRSKPKQPREGRPTGMVPDPAAPGQLKPAEYTARPLPAVRLSEALRSRVEALQAATEATASDVVRTALARLTQDLGYAEPLAPEDTPPKGLDR